jgi:hypothetical protein
MTPAEFEPTISANERAQTLTLGRAAVYTLHVWPNLAAAASMRPKSPMIKAPHVDTRLHNQQYGQVVRQVNK